MFTGLIQTLGRVVHIEPGANRARFFIEADKAFARLESGDSICVSGVCLTAAQVLSPNSFSADVMGITLKTSRMAKFSVGQSVNLETSLTPSSLIGGHLVQGHVEAVARLIDLELEDKWSRLRFSLPPRLAPLVALKGSIALDGVSLTVSNLSEAKENNPWFEVCLIPETLENTTLKTLVPPNEVNLETDILARHLDRLLAFGRGGKNN